MGTASRPAVDVLIVSFNTKSLLRDCLCSIFLHPPPCESIEVVVSVFDNGSPDGSAEVVAEEFPQVRLVRSDENLGFGQAMNILAATSTATYLMPLNSDTLWPGDIVTPLVDFLEREPDVAIVSPRLISPDGTLQLSSEDMPGVGFEFALMLHGTRFARIPRLWDATAIVRRVRQAERAGELEPRDTEFVWATCWLLRRGLVEQFGLFDEAFVLYDEDLDFCFRLRKRGARIVYYPSVTLIHLGGASSTYERKRLAMQRGRRLYYRRNHGRMALLAYRLATEGIGSVQRLTARIRCADRR